MSITSIKGESEFPDEWMGKLIRTKPPYCCTKCFTFTSQVISRVAEKCIKCHVVVTIDAHLLYTLVDRVLIEF